MEWTVLESDEAFLVGWPSLTDAFAMGSCTSMKTKIIGGPLILHNSDFRGQHVRDEVTLNLYYAVAREYST